MTDKTSKIFWFFSLILTCMNRNTSEKTISDYFNDIFEFPGVIQSTWNKNHQVNFQILIVTRLCKHRTTFRKIKFRKIFKKSTHRIFVRNKFAIKYFPLLCICQQFSKILEYPKYFWYPLYKYIKFFKKENAEKFCDSRPLFFEYRMNLKSQTFQKLTKFLPTKGLSLESSSDYGCSWVSGRFTPQTFHSSTFHPRTFIPKDI